MKVQLFKTMPFIFKFWLKFKGIILLLVFLLMKKLVGRYLAVIQSFQEQ